MLTIDAEQYIGAGEQIFDVLNRFDGQSEAEFFMNDSDGNLQPVRMSPTEPIVEINGFEAYEPDTLTPQEFVASFCEALTMFEGMKPVEQTEISLLADAVILAWLRRKKNIAMDHAVTSTDTMSDELAGASLDEHIGRLRTCERAVEAEKVYRRFAEELRNGIAKASAGER